MTRTEERRLVAALRQAQKGYRRAVRQCLQANARLSASDYSGSAETMSEAIDIVRRVAKEGRAK